MLPPHLSKHTGDITTDGPVSRPAMLTALVRRRLLASAYTALRGVECKVLYDVASLEGTLGSHYLKQVAQAFALAVEGIGQVENRIHVTPVRVMPGRRV